MRSSHARLASLAFSLALTLPPAARATIQLPSQMSSQDRMQALRIVGLGLSNKILSDPYPLGGYKGLEAGLSYESLPGQDLARLGSGIQPAQQDPAVAQLSIGKGLYNNIDVFFQLTPYTRENELSRFGGILRWGFYQASYLPLSLSLLLYGNSINLANKLSVSSGGADVIGGIDVDNVSVFAGVGGVQASGVFAGDASGVTSSGVQENEFVSGPHTVIGASIRFSSVFVALQMDRTAVSVFSAKLGLRL